MAFTKQSNEYHVFNFDFDYGVKHLAEIEKIIRELETTYETLVTYQEVSKLNNEATTVRALHEAINWTHQERAKLRDAHFNLEQKLRRYHGL